MMIFYSIHRPDTTGPGREAAPLQRCQTVLPESPCSRLPPATQQHCNEDGCRRPPTPRPQFIGCAIRCNVSLLCYGRPLSGAQSPAPIWSLSLFPLFPK